MGFIQPILSYWLPWVLVYFLIIAVHEVGHYLAGRLVGVPSASMRIRLLTFPQHVALRDGEDWVCPLDTERYVRLADPLMPTAASAATFVAGGFVLETLCLAFWCLLRLPYAKVAISLALMMTIIYLLVDLWAFLRTRRQLLDFSVLYYISPGVGVMFVIAVLGSMCGLFFFSLGSVTK